MSAAAGRSQEIAWRRASLCANGECVEVGSQDGLILVRDSKDPAGAVLSCSKQEWRAFANGIKAGEFDSLDT